MDIDDKELFSSATADDSTPEVTPEAPAEVPSTETPQQDERPRDEHGRFAAKQAEPEAQSPPQQAPAEQAPAEDGAHVPSWRLREIRDERDAATQRYLETQRQLEMLQRQMPKPAPPPAPDPYENPDGFARYHAEQTMSPLEQRIQAAEMRLQAQLEANSRRDAFREHTEPLVRTSYEWIKHGVQSQDPEVVHAYNRAMQSDHPYDAIVQAYKSAEIVQQIRAAGGPDKYREQLLAAGQPQQQQNRQPSSGQPPGSVYKLPPSLRNTPSARTAGEDDPNDLSDAALFRYSTR
jgi:hypothetical protein